MYKRFAKFLSIICVALVMPLCFCACKEEEDKVVDYVISPMFTSLTIYQGDEVDLEDFHIDLIYKSSKVETFKLTKDNVLDFSTEQVGQHEAYVLIGTTKYSFTYTVLPITLRAVRYVEDQLLIYVDEQPDSDLVRFLMLYSNDNEIAVNGEGLIHTDIDYTLDDQVKTMVYNVGGFSVNVEYKVTCRPMVEGQDYEVADQDAIVRLQSEDDKLMFNFYNAEGDCVYTTQVQAVDFNRFTFFKINGRELVSYVAYLSGGKLKVDIV